MKIHYHTDCYFFGGCENMLVVFFNDRYLMKNFEVSFSYHFSKKYDSGLRQRIKKLPDRTFRLKFLDIYDLLSVNNKISRKIAGMLNRLYISNFLFFIIDFLIFYKLFKRLKPDILHINNGGYPGAFSCRPSVIAARLTGVKKILFIVNNVPQPYNCLNRWMHSIL